MAKKNNSKTVESNPIGHVIIQELSDEIKKDYLDYAMSVIVQRALPDVRDGLKPVARRILYSMWQQGLRSTAKFRKSAYVVGDVLGKYHPHSDTAVYDALARITQEFSMRHPLIQGQGNWGCFTGDTKVQLTDGRQISFKNLVKEHAQGKRHWTFAYNHQEKRIEISEIQKPRVTRKNASLVEVKIDTGQIISCTPDHRFMMRDGKYREASLLQPGDSLMPLYLRASEGVNNKHLKDYTEVRQPAAQQWEYVHHLADHWNIDHSVYNKDRGRVRHHVDFNKYNNDPSNIQRLHWAEHFKLHARLTSWRHKHNPEYVARLKKGREKYIKNNHQAISERTSERNKKMWQDPIYRRNQIKRLKAMWEDEDYRDFMRQQSSKNLKALWQDTDFKTLMSKNKSQELRDRWTDVAYRKKMTRHMQNLSRQIWSDPKHRKYISARMKEITADPEWRLKQSQLSKALWEDAAYQAKFPANHFSKMAKKLWQKEGIRELHRDKAKQQWQDPSFRENMISAVKVSNQKRLLNNPAMMADMASQASVSLREKWQNPEYKKKVIRSKIFRHVKNILRKYGDATPELYELERQNNGVPNIKRTLQNFNNFDEIVESARHYNHSVIAVRKLPTREDVYDITVDPWHNFALAAGIFVHNSIDGDSPAAMRYTEAKLHKLADEMLINIEKNTVDFTDNYDGTRREPLTLPATLPNFLINGTLGIAVGMATNVPPHNLAEICDAAIHLIARPSATVEDLMKFVQGPDFPTGGSIYNRQEILQAYATGKGSIVMRAVANIDEMNNGTFRIIVSEIPYLVNKATLITKIADAVKSKRIEGIKDLRDESDKSGIRVVIELKKDAFPKKILNRLFAITDLQKTFHVNMLALVDRGRQPQVLSLKEVLLEHIKHRREVITRRTQFDLDRARERAHILEGLKKALDHINEVIATIRKSRTREHAHANLCQQFKLSTAQSTAILEMRLQTLAGLERKKVEDELLEKRKLIKELESILKDPKKVAALVKAGYQELRDKYGEPRRTKVFARAVSEFSQEDLIPDEPTIISVTRGGYIKRLATSTYRVQRRGGKGVRGMATKEEDIVDLLLATTTHKQLLFFTNRGRVFSTPAYEIPVTTRTAKGQALQNFLELAQNEHVTAIEAISPDQGDNDCLVMATAKGLIKKTPRQQFANIRRSGLIAINLNQDDNLEWVGNTTGHDQVLLISRLGLAVRFSEGDVRPMGRTASGVRGMRLKVKDEVVAMHVIPPTDNSHLQVLVITENGYGKRTPLKEYRLTRRGGTGIKTANITAKTGVIVNADIIDANQLTETDVLIISEKGQIIRVDCDGIGQRSRATQGVKVMSPTAQSGKVATFTTWTEATK